jgi:hypothetical protein
MGFAALITWFIAILAGLYMLAVWLIENDITSCATPSRLPAPIMALGRAGRTCGPGPRAAAATRAR